jgi:hypothetical protein
MNLLWYVRPGSLVNIYQCFGETCCLHPKGRNMYTFRLEFCMQFLYFTRVLHSPVVLSFHSESHKRGHTAKTSRKTIKNDVNALNVIYFHTQVKSTTYICLQGPRENHERSSSRLVVSVGVRNQHRRTQHRQVIAELTLLSFVSSSTNSEHNPFSLGRIKEAHAPE